MNSVLESKFKNLPNNPGVYQFKNDKGKVIYVGKAINLKSRVRSYFTGVNQSAKTAALISKTYDLELIVTDNEVEALVLENNLIKELKPRYNVNLKDDKSFPFIKVTNEPYPRIYPTRRLIRDGSKYFGPYTSVSSMKNSLRMINQLFKIRSCKLNITQESIGKKKFKVCLDYHIKKCDGPCEGLISEKDYGDMVGEVVKVLKGKTDDLIDDLNDKMKRLVELLEFEKAAELRDRMEQLKIISSKQKVVSDDFEDRDIIALAYEGKDSACSVFNVRNGKLVGKKQLRLAIEEGEELANIYSAAIKFYYTDFTDIPKEIVVEVEPTDLEILSEWLSRNANRKVRLTIPQRGNLRSLIKMCSENALLQLKEIQIQKMKNEGQVSYSVSALQRDLRLPNLPKKIECFDISNLQGTDTVASLVVFEDGKPRKSLYRKYIIKDVSGPDDFLSMQEVIRRRYTKVVQGEDKLPDLIMVDGGKGQLSSAIESIKDLGIKNFTIIGLAKRLEEVYLTGQSEPASISKTSSGLKLLQKIRDEAHRFAITFHRKRRSKRTIKTELTNIKGIGSSTAQKLLKELGSFSAIKNTDHAKLISLVGKQKANLIKKYFDENSP
ncbi:MAG: excinuclease ABC subunit C [Ignavibacteria bacterium RBG_16_35_7]|nr:MAG: excinuclease ABC subunit C [Ignavibacteria bacterium RBG_16_35_7]